MSLSDYLNGVGVVYHEGYCEQVPKQVDDLIWLIKDKNINNIAEIGFNAGHSANTFLKNNNSLILTSFDLGMYSYVYQGKQYIDANYPNRHTLIVGDSRTTVPAFINANKQTKFDLIFIDGGHEYDVSKSDLENCFHLAHKDTIVIMDDTIFTNGWEAQYTIGPTRAWTEFLSENKVIEISRKEYEPYRGMCWGKYAF